MKPEKQFAEGRTCGKKTITTNRQQKEIIERNNLNGQSISPEIKQPPFFFRFTKQFKIY